MVLRTAYKMKPPLSVRPGPGHPLADKLIAEWLLREGSGVKAFDSSGRSHTGTLEQGATWTAGKFGRAVDLGGTDGRIVIADHADFTPALHPFSISALIYMHDATKFPIASKSLGITEKEWVLWTGTLDKLNFYLYDQTEGGNIGRYYTTALTPLQNTWLHVVATYDGGTSDAGTKLYLNATRVDDDNLSTGTFVTVRSLSSAARIGNVGANYANGLVSNVMIWRRVLTLSDVQLLRRRLFRRFEQRSILRSAAAGAA